MLNGTKPSASFSVLERVATFFILYICEWDVHASENLLEFDGILQLQKLDTFIYKVAIKCEDDSKNILGCVVKLY